VPSVYTIGNKLDEYIFFVFFIKSESTQTKKKKKKRKRTKGETQLDDTIGNGIDVKTRILYDFKGIICQYINIILSGKYLNIYYRLTDGR
jgi:hypothetical protein